MRQCGRVREVANDRGRPAVAPAKDATVDRKVEGAVSDRGDVVHTTVAGGAGHDLSAPACGVDAQDTPPAGPTGGDEQRAVGRKRDTIGLDDRRPDDDATERPGSAGDAGAQAPDALVREDDSPPVASAPAVERKRRDAIAVLAANDDPRGRRSTHEEARLPGCVRIEDGKWLRQRQLRLGFRRGASEQESDGDGDDETCHRARDDIADPC